MESIPKSRYFIQSLAKGLKVLNELTEAKKPLALSEIAQALKTNNAGATRLCYTLEQLGYIQRDNHRKYHLTPQVLSLGYAALCEMDWKETAKFYLEELFAEVGENVNLAILEGPFTIYLIRILNRDVLPYTVRVGSKVPVYCTSMGKVLLAFSPPEIVGPILDALEFRPITPHTITNLKELMVEIEKIKRDGYALNYEEFSLGAGAVSAPVFGKDNDAIAAVSIGVSTMDYTRMDMFKNLVPPLQEKARLITEALKSIEFDFRKTRRPKAS